MVQRTQVQNSQNVNPAQLSLTPAQVMQLPAAQQAAYLNSLSPQMLAIYHQEVQDMGNVDFMRNSLEELVYCPVTGGSGTSAAYSLGTTLNFDLPITQGYAKELIIRYNLTVTPSAGTNATYALTPAGRYAIFNRVELDYGNPQVVTHPYLFKVQDMMAGRNTAYQNQVVSGLVQDQSLSNVIAGQTPIVVGSGNTWQGYFTLRLNPIAPESPFGLLPLSGIGGNVQLKLTTPSNLYGADPLLNGICAGANNGSGNAVTVTGTVWVDCIVLDGRNMEGVVAKTLSGVSAGGMTTMQYYWESSLTPFNPNLQNVFTVRTKLEHWQMVAIVIDGQQSTSFISGLSNLSNFGLSPDATLQQYLLQYNISNNIPIYEWFSRRRGEIRQDLDEGVIAWVNAAGRGVNNPSNRNGSQALNCYADGFPAASHVYTVGATSSSNNITPRVELFLVSKNRQGLAISG